MASIKDVARLANVSISTVSLAYNQPARVSPQTRSAIFAAAKELGFSPSRHESAQPGQKSVMFILSGIRETHVPTMQGVQDTCRALSLNLLPMVALGEEDGRVYAPVESAIRQGHVSGIISAGAGVLSLNRAAEERGIPMVFLMRPFSDPDSAEVLLNNHQIGADMASHLVKNGYSSIAVVGGPADHPRMIGFRDELRRRGISVYDENGWMDAASPVDDCPGAYSLLCNVISTQSNLPDAIFCQTDMIALGVLSALQSYGLRVPEDVAVAGCEDIDLSRITDPQLTSVQFPRYEQGVHAALLLSRMIAGRPSERIVLNGKLIERGSTRRR